LASERWMTMAVGAMNSMTAFPVNWRRTEVWLMVSETEAIQCRVVPILDGTEGWTFDATDD